MKIKLSERVRPNSEAAPWVIEEIKELEEKIVIAFAEGWHMGRNTTVVNGEFIHDYNESETKQALENKDDH